jgi:hypothetical protein
MDFHFTLLENGLDFVLSSLEHLTAAQSADNSDDGGQKRNLKYALIHLCSGIELVLKERLRQEDWELVFQNQNEATEEAYESGDFKSVNFKTLQDRLEEECGVDLTPQQRSDLHTFRNRRNRVEHFNVIDTLLALQSSIAQMVSFLVDFVEENFEIDEFEEEEQRLLAEIRGRLSACAAVVEERLASIKPEIEKLYSVVQCPFCLQMAMHADDGTVKCLFCHASPEPSEAADDYVMNVLGYSHRDEVEKDGGEWPIHTCPECGHDTFVTAVAGRFDAEDFYCFNCGLEYGSGEVELCHECNEYYPHNDEAGMHICPKCFHEKVTRDD